MLKVGSLLIIEIKRINLSTRSQTGQNKSWRYNHKGPPQLKKSLKFQLLAEIFWTPSPPSSKKGPTDENVGISYLIVIIKFGFFRVSNPSPPISSESRTSPILSIEVAPNRCASRLVMNFYMNSHHLLYSLSYINRHFNVQQKFI